MITPIIISVILVIVILTNGVQKGIDFRGGTWIEIVKDKEIDSFTMNSLKNELSNRLDNLKFYSHGNRLIIVTTSLVEENEIKPLLERYIGKLSSVDTASVKLSEKPPVELKDKLEGMLKKPIDLEFDENTKILKISAMELDKDRVKNALDYYLSADITVNLQKKNLSIREVGATLSKHFKEEGIRAVLIAYLLMAVVIFVAFRDFIPSLAVILAATCDVIFAIGGMSIFGILLEPASLVAILMLIGYSVDTDIMLTTRVLKRKSGEVDEKIDDAMKTGLTMTGTTLAVMIVIILISEFVTQISTLTCIASVLLMGLLGDLTTTWFMNAGILKWYIERKRKKKR